MCGNNGTMHAPSYCLEKVSRSYPGEETERMSFGLAYLKKQSSEFEEGLEFVRKNIGEVGTVQRESYRDMLIPLESLANN